MKKLLAIVVLGLLINNTVNADETFLSCTSDSGGSITLSFDTKTKIGKEYVGGDSKIIYDLNISDANLLFQRFYEGSFIRGWNIDRYSGNATLNSTFNSDPNDKSIRSYEYNCRRGSKIF